MISDYNTSIPADKIGGVYWDTIVRRNKYIV